MRRRYVPRPDIEPMPKGRVDVREAELPDGLTIIRAAEKLDIEVPHYCWHPGLTIAGNCRMCLVESEKVPKLQIACNTRVTEGMVVHTQNDRVKKAQQSVLEFLLVNHPIDCPICDQAGECKLQDYYMDFDKSPSRFPVEEKVRKRKVVDICPVGALTSKDFRFKARVWYLKKTDSVCAFCANGCNIEIHHREGQIHRFRPRYNPEVNDYWMCDEGRMGYHRIQGEGRLLAAQVRQGDELRTVSWQEALDTVGARLRKVQETAGEGAIGAVVSAFASNEEAFLLARLVGGANGTLAGHAWSPSDACGDDLLIKADKNPNRRGLEAMGIHTGTEAV